MDDGQLYEEIIKIKGIDWNPPYMGSSPIVVDVALSLIEHIDKAEITRVFTAGENWQWFVRLPIPGTRDWSGTNFQEWVTSINFKLSRAICEAWLLWMRHGQKLEP